VSEGGSDGCRPGRALLRSSWVTTSPDGRNVYVGSENSGAVDVFARSRRTGALVQPAGTAGCVSMDGAEGCAVGRALAITRPVLVSGDGGNVYAGTRGGVAVFRRSPRNGSLAQLRGAAGCVTDPPGEGCASGRALTFVRALAISPDGRSVYAASVESGALVVFARNRRSGALRQLGGAAGCIAEDAREGCAKGRALSGLRGVAVSTDGRWVYAVGLGGGIAAFARSARTGALSQLAGPAGCLKADGSEGCQAARGIADTHSIVLSPDGRNAYVVGALANAVSEFKRNRRTGELTQLPGELGCLQQDGLDGCRRGHGLQLAHTLVLNREGTLAYLASVDSNSIDVLRRNRTTGALIQVSGAHGCVSEGGTEGCSAVRGIAGTHHVALSPDGRNVYAVAETGFAVATFTVVP
jgi:6-phosphogluconolactonase (cycloisomerase 2 family)